MGRQWSAGKLVLILDAVHWNPEAPPRTLPRVRLRCGKAPPCCASSQLRRVSLVILIKPRHWMSSFPTGRRFLFPQINEEGRSQLILPKNRKRSAMPGRGDGKRNGSEEKNWGSQCFSTLNEMRQPRDALLLTPQGSETELNLSLG